MVQVLFLLKLSAAFVCTSRHSHDLKYQWGSSVTIVILKIYFGLCWFCHHGGGHVAVYCTTSHFEPQLSLQIMSLVKGWTIDDVGFYWWLGDEIQTGSGAHPASCSMAAGVLFPGVKRSGREADHSPPCSEGMFQANLKPWR